jgi:hypothetical protein
MQLLHQGNWNGDAGWLYLQVALFVCMQIWISFSVIIFVCLLCIVVNYYSSFVLNEFSISESSVFSSYQVLLVFSFL